MPLEVPKKRENRREIIIKTITEYPNDIPDEQGQLLLQCIVRELFDIADDIRAIASNSVPRGVQAVPLTPQQKFQPLNPKPDAE